MLPGPGGVGFRPLLVTSRDPGLVERVVLLVTDRIWTAALGMFLDYCHSTWGDGRVCVDTSSLSLFWWRKSARWKAGRREKSRRGISMNEHSVNWRRKSVVPDARRGIIHVSVFLPSLLLLLYPAVLLLVGRGRSTRKWLNWLARGLVLCLPQHDRAIKTQQLSQDVDVCSVLCMSSPSDLLWIF